MASDDDVTRRRGLLRGYGLDALKAAALAALVVAVALGIAYLLGSGC